MESYIVRIYRRHSQDRRQVAGTVEEVGKARTRPFANIEELWSILAGKIPRATGADRGGGRAPARTQARRRVRRAGIVAVNRAPRGHDIQSRQRRHGPAPAAPRPRQR